MSNPENMPASHLQKTRIRTLERILADPEEGVPDKYYAAQRRIGELERRIIVRDRRALA